MSVEMEPVLKQLGLREQPFAPTADPAYFYATRGHRECLFRLWSSVDERHGIAVVLGDYGTGKTTLLRKLLTGMGAQPERYNTAVIGSPIPSWTSFSLLESIIAQFSLRPDKRSFVAYMESLNQYLIQNRARINTLIIDDAQNLNKRGQLELLRLVQNLELPQHKLLNLVLFAQMEWTAVLKAAPNFLQRINMTYTLGPLDAAETRDMIEFRLAQAGAAPETLQFDDAAVRAIHAYAQGSPRIIITLCRNAVILASQLRMPRIGQEIILHTIQKTMLPDQEKRAQVLAALTASDSRREQPTPPRPPVREEFPAQDPKRAVALTREERANQLLLRAARSQPHKPGTGGAS
ncbi:MAG TPA: AAA family ATPase [Candidatus Hydrogenedentes bacterium]|nr:AAA family ATPase [Candidatus Hydrogenedentota bacterium]HOS02684.1 AAA family ATPase [Candidatus Hydrogenedentota bacterium]